MTITVTARPSSDGLETMLTTCDLADALSVSPRTLDNWRSASRGPAYFRIEGTVRYRMSDVVAWLEGQQVQTLESLSGRRRP
ncbi:helix-turn-helix transcriptional regulator [Actinomyces gaoshouyii]|uniref:helix-turn-helix transcriptional regulator n=1 Tax=Actinomyces gaoshouyii TaxID=1960083 RepID=UPI0009BE44D6|nr:helix-turn-helix domain-containing protein [Actinomyces gaoshouyii]ARD42451.1 hypothetical protein B6G06_08980 [Actinomyces gaoshouyii]